MVVAWDGRFPPISLQRASSSAYLVTEQGDEIPLTLDDRQLLCEQQLPIGYHELYVAGVAQPTLVISAPLHAHPAPSGALGVVAPVYSLRNAEADTGIGSYGHLSQFADAALVAGASVVGTLPLVATFADEPSPYSPASRRAWNELFVDLSAAPGWKGTAPRFEGDPMWVDYDETGRHIREAIAAYATWVADQPQLKGRVVEFAAANPETARYAAFRAACDKHGRDWRSWPEAAAGDPHRLNYHLTGQWLATEQLGELGRRLSARQQYLYLDLPIGCHPDGFDIWDQPNLYAPASVGAPPDSLFLGGQDWGLPATIPNRSRRDGHQAFIKAVRHQLSVAGLLRIDHVMGLHRTWWVPHGLAATDGAYVMQPTDEMFAIICLESQRAGAGVIGENLGTVPEEISLALDEHRLLGMKVAQDGLNQPGKDELIALSTHDSPPFAAWWKGTDIDDGEDLGVYADGRGDVARSHRSDTLSYFETELGTEGLARTRDALLDWMAGSAAAIAIVNVDDLWGEERRQNVPGTHTERPNWRARHALPIDDFITDPRIVSRLEHLQEIRLTTQDGPTDSDHVSL